MLEPQGIARTAACVERARPRKVPLVWALAPVLGAGLLAQPVRAQEAITAPDGGALAPIVITGSGAADARWRGSASVDVVDGSELRNGQLQINLSEGLGRVPGLVIRNRENYAQDLQVSVRGFGSRATFGVRGVRLFVDGIPASAPDGSGQAANFPLASAERIEVVRGPFAALYGASSGGAILLYTEDGGEPGEWRVGAGVAENGLWRLSTQLSGRIGGEAGWSYALDTGRFETDGRRPQSAANRSTTNAKLARAHEGGRTVLVFNRQTSFALDPQGLRREDFDADPTQTASQAIDFNTRKSVSQTQFGIAWDQALGGGHKLELMGYVGQRRVVQFQSIPPTAQNAATSSGGVIDLDRDYGGLNARWRLQREWQGGQLDLSVGLAADRQTDLRLGYNNFTGPSGAPTAIGVQGILRRDETNRADTLDPYLRASWARDSLTLEGGLRRVRAEYTSTDRYLANGDDSGSTRYTRTLPVIGARWQLAPQTQLFASVGEGLETPTLNEAAYRSGGATGLNTDLNAARSSSAEIGLRGRNAHGLWNATLFHVRTQDEIVVESSGGGRTVFTNAGRTERLGAELSAEYGLGDAWVLTSAWTWLRARYEASADARFPAGNALPGVPAQQFFAQLAWSPRWAAPAGGVFTLEARHTGRVFVNDVNDDAAEGHSLFALGARFEQVQGPWTFRQFVRIDNLSDRRHAGSVIVNDGNGRFFEPGAGRTVSAGVEFVRRF
jgi:iron complex outermembrane receptor protein